MGELMMLNPATDRSITTTILESHADYHIVEFHLNHFIRSITQIDGQDYFQINLPLEALRLDKGAPELPVVARSLIIPPQSKMHVEVLESSYKEFPGHVIPSKGLLYRDVSPSAVPFEFSEVYQSDMFFPKSQVELGDPYIMRELRGIAFRVSPFSYNPVQGVIRYYDRLLFKVYADGYDTIDVMPTRSPIITTDFIPIYQSRFLNYTQEMSRYTPLFERGSMLVICFPAFMDAMQPYVDWKNQKGIHTVMIPSTTAGSTHTQIRAYIQSYWTANPSLAFVQLVGDAPQIATPSHAGGGSDPSYVMLIGANSYPDILIGRFSAENVAHVQTQVERSIFYERDLSAGAWLSKAYGMASNDPNLGHNSERDFDHMEVIRQLFLNNGTFTTVDQFYQTPNPITSTPVTVAGISAAFNEGRSVGNFVGHGSETSWTFPPYTNNHVNALTNDNRLPFLFSVACVNGNFVGLTCFAEAWLRATNNTTGAPTGAIATFMSSINQPWIPPMWAQDHFAVKLVEGLTNTIGAHSFNAASHMLDISTAQGFIDTIRTWHIFGDASLALRTKAPLAMNLSSASTIEHTATVFPVTTDTPGALVSLFDPVTKVLLGSAYANATGNATINITSSLPPSGTVWLTTTAQDRITDVRDISVGSVTTPVFSINPASHNFGAVVISDTSEVQTFTITNAGNAELIISEVYKGGADQEQYYLSAITDLPWIISHMDTRTFDVAFSPTSAGVKTANITIVDNLPSTPSSGAISRRSGEGDKNDVLCRQRATHTISLSGTGLSPAIFSLSHDAIGFGDLTLGQTPATQTITITNTGGVNLIVTSMTLSGDSSQFTAIAADLPWTILPNGTRNVNVSFVPNTSGVKEASLNFIHNASGSTASLPLTGVALTPAIFSIDPALYDFGSVDSGTNSVPQTFTITNTGEADLTVSSIVINGSDENYFILQNTAGTPLAISGGHSHTITVTFAPLTFGMKYASIDIHHDTTGSPYAVTIEGYSPSVSDSDVVAVIEKTELLGNYPNPFNPETTIQFALESDSHVQIDVYNIKGHKIATVTSKTFPAGRHNVIWHGKDENSREVASGIYFYQMTTDGYSAMRKMLLMK
jgi:hypothetical protein